MNEYVKSDLMRLSGKYDILTFMKQYLRNRTFRFLVAFRMCQCTKLRKLFGLVLWTFNRTKYQIQIPRTTKIGYGLYIGHGGPIIVNPTAIIGNNCNLSQFTTIGSNENHAARIGDNVYIGPNVCIIEDVIIGNNVTIGGGECCNKGYS